MDIFLPRQVVLTNDGDRVVEIGGTLALLGCWVCVSPGDKIAYEHGKAKADQILRDAGGWGPIHESLRWQPIGCGRVPRGHDHA